MVRLFGALSALLIAATILSLTILGVGWLFPIALSHGVSRWFVPACNLFTVICLIIAGLRRRRLKLKGDSFNLLNEP
jgi:hypothetical protein